MCRIFLHMEQDFAILRICNYVESSGLGILSVSPAQAVSEGDDGDLNISSGVTPGRLGWTALNWVIRERS